MKTHAIITTSIRRGILAGAMLGVTAFTSHAAVVTWQAPQAITGDSDVSAAGTRVIAGNFGGTGVGNTTVNGTLFNANVFVSGINGLTTGIAPFSNLSASYQTLLSSGSTRITSLGVATTIGRDYLFEVWSNNSVGPSSFVTVTSGGNSVTLGSNLASATGGLGQFAIGTFTADAASQVFSFTSAGAYIVNGFQLRLLPAAAVPEPGSALAGLLALGVCLSGLGGRSRQAK